MLRYGALSTGCRGCIRKREFFRLAGLALDATVVRYRI